jgi:hypothetical protein
MGSGGSGAQTLGGLLGLGGLFGGNAAKTDRGIQLGGFGDLSKLFNFGFGQGQTQEGQGQQTEQTALSQLASPAAYYSKILNGGRQGALSAAAPTVNAANAGADAQRTQIANLGQGRGGGVNAVGQNVETNKNATVDSAINQARQGAATGATQVGNATAGVGATQLQNAMSLLGLAENAGANITSLAGNSREESNALHRQSGDQVGKSIGQILLGMNLGQGNNNNSNSQGGS